MENIIKKDEEVYVPGMEETPAPMTIPADVPVDPQPEYTDLVPEVGDTTCADSPCPEETVIKTVTLGEFFGTLQEAVTLTWRYHLKTRKHHVHVELNNFYHNMLHLTDRLIEQSQSIFGVIGDYTNTIFDYGKDELTYLNELRGYIVANRYDVISKEFTELHSSLDEIIGEIDSIIYKLTTFEEPAVQTFEAFCYEHYDRLYENEEKDYSDDEDDVKDDDINDDNVAFDIPDDEDDDVKEEE